MSLYVDGVLGIRQQRSCHEDRVGIAADEERLELLRGLQPPRGEDGQPRHGRPAR